MRGLRWEAQGMAGILIYNTLERPYVRKESL